MTGYDYIIYTDLGHAGVARLVFDFYSAAGFEPIVEVEDAEGDSRQVSDTLPTLDNDNRDGNVIYYYTDASLSEHHLDHGYLLRPDGVGPVALFYRRRTPLLLQASGVRDLRPQDGSATLDYTATISCRHVREVTLVLPSRPSESDFVNNLVTWVTSRLAGV